MILSSRKEQQEHKKALAADTYVDNDLAFPNPDGEAWGQDVFTTQFSELAESISMQGFRFRDLRHALASMTLADGVSIKEVQIPAENEANSGSRVTFSASIAAGRQDQLTKPVCMQLSR